VSPVFDVETGFGGNGASVPGADIPPFLTSGKGMPFGEPPTMFGGDGHNPIAEAVAGGTGGGCLMSGPFKDVKLRIGPMGKMDPSNVRCLRRNFHPKLGEQVTKAAMRSLMDSKVFGNLRMSIEAPFSISGAAPFHTVGHQGVGGEV
jgi:tyrosinase